MTYRKIETSIWSDSKFVELSATARYAYQYLMTSPHGNLAGCYECSVGLLARDTGLSREDVEAALAEISDKGMIAIDEATNEILVRKFGKHQWSKSDRLVKALRRDIDEVASDALRSELEGIFEDFMGLPYRDGSDTVGEDADMVPIPSDIPSAIPSGDHMHMVSDDLSTDETAGQIPSADHIDTNSGSGTGLNPIPESVETPTPLQPERARASDDSPDSPTLGDVRAYASKAGIVVDCDEFFIVNEERHWRLDGQPIRNWRALLKSWAEAKRRGIRDERRARGDTAKRSSSGKIYEKCPKCGGAVADYGKAKQCVICGHSWNAFNQQAVAS